MNLTTVVEGLWHGTPGARLHLLLEKQPPKGELDVNLLWLLPFVVMPLSEVIGSVPKPMTNMHGLDLMGQLVQTSVLQEYFILDPVRHFPIENAILETNTGSLPLVYAAGLYHQVFLR